MVSLLTVTEGPDKGKAFELHDEVIRVGSASDMVVQIAAIPDHALTLMRNDQRYDVINRGCDRLKVNGRLLSPGKSTKWRRGRKLEIDDSVTLFLQDIESARHPLPLTSVDDSLAAESMKRTSPIASTKNVMNAFVATVAVGVIMALLPSRSIEDHKFYENVVNCATDPRYMRPHDQELRSVIRKLRRARLDDVRMDRRSALYRYRQLKADLNLQVAEQHRKQAEGDSEQTGPTLEQLILSFVNQRIRVLG